MRSLDRSDISLLREVTSNARCSHVELAERVGLSSTACARRLAALEQDGLIEGYQAVLGLKALGLGTTVVVRITLDSQSEDALQAFERAVIKCPSVVRCLLMSGFHNPDKIALGGRSVGLAKPFTVQGLYEAVDAALARPAGSP